MDATMKKLRISIQTLASIEIISVAIMMIFIFVGLRMDIKDPTAIGAATVLSYLFMVQLLNIVWLMSFDKDYPSLYRLWVLKQVVLLFLLGTFAFYFTAMNMNVATFLPVALIIAEFVMVRIYREKLQEAADYARMQETPRNVV